jgi:hypothetical protein
VANRPYGRGFPEKLKYLQAEINTIHNQRIDSAAARIMNPVFYNEGSSFEPTKYQMEPGGAYPVGNVNDVKWANPPDASISQYREEEIVERYIERLTAASENIQGVVTSGEKTATEIAAANERGNIRFDLVFRRIESSFIELFNQVVYLNQENMPPEKEYRIVGHDGRFKWTSITDAEMNGRFDLALTSTSIMNDRAKLARAQMLYQAAITNPIITSNQRALYENTKYFFLSVGGRDINIDRLLPKPPQAAVRTPEEEHELMYNGKPVQPDVREDAQLHLVTHDGEINQPEFATEIAPEIQQLFIQHVEQTKALVAAQLQMQSQGTFGQIGTAPLQPGQNVPAPAAGQGGIA